ncbi:unnamed protein product [Anisakis simplex]|uniref:MIT_C domain-containing protein n=1 Tax=Anisakis simplex TaxID=6269 RepID=A0A0M3IY63_ANISI|nr:unnamed protein product [Anisakis simplex]
MDSLSEDPNNLKRSIFSDECLRDCQSAKMSRTGSEPVFGLKPRNCPTDDVDRWTKLLASQLDTFRESLECVKTDERDVNSIRHSSSLEESPSLNQLLTDFHLESAESGSCTSSASASSAMSICSESGSSVISLPDRSPTRQQPTRRAPDILGSLNIKELLDEGAMKRSSSSKGYNVKLVKEIHIEDGTLGYGYDRLFADALDAKLRSVFVNDPYIKLRSQAANFVVFCEVLVANALNLKRIVLRTQNDPSVNHRVLFSHLTSSLFQNGIHLEIKRSETIHDREIRFDNGWIYRIGRGLDYFHKQPHLTIGLSNYNLRRCLETTVCITKEI